MSALHREQKKNTKENKGINNEKQIHVNKWQLSESG